MDRGLVDLALVVFGTLFFSFCSCTSCVGMRKKATTVIIGVYVSSFDLLIAVDVSAECSPKLGIGLIAFSCSVTK